MRASRRRRLSAWSDWLLYKANRGFKNIRGIFLWATHFVTNIKVLVGYIEEHKEIKMLTLSTCKLTSVILLALSHFPLLQAADFNLNAQCAISLGVKADAVSVVLNSTNLNSDTFLNISSVSKLVNATIASGLTLDIRSCNYQVNGNSLVQVASFCVGASAMKNNSSKNSTALTSNSTSPNCVTAALYEGSPCSSASVCDKTAPTFTMNCGGISQQYPSCALTCQGSGTSLSAISTCYDLAKSPSPTTAPAKTSAAASIQFGDVTATVLLPTMATAALTLAGVECFAA